MPGGGANNVTLLAQSLEDAAAYPPGGRIGSRAGGLRRASEAFPLEEAAPSPAGSHALGGGAAGAADDGGDAYMLPLAAQHHIGRPRRASSLAARELGDALAKGGISALHPAGDDEDMTLMVLQHYEALPAVAPSQPAPPLAVPGAAAGAGGDSVARVAHAATHAAATTAPGPAAAPPVPAGAAHLVAVVGLDDDADAFVVSKTPASASAAASVTASSSSSPSAAPPPVATPAAASPAAAPAAGSPALPASAPAFVEFNRIDLIRVVRLRVAAEEAAGACVLGTSSSRLSAWDVHFIDPAADARPGFVLRRGCFLLSMEPLRVVLTSHAFFICPEAGYDGELEPLLARLRRGSGDGGSASSPTPPLPLPLLALSAILDVCYRDMVVDMRAAAAAVSNLSSKLRHRRGAEEVLQERFEQVEVELQRLTERFESVLRAVASFSDGESRHDTEGSKATRQTLAAAHALVVDFGMRVEVLESAARESSASMAARKRQLALAKARHRNAILLVGLFLQLATSCFGFCSMMSGWYGMNLDNGTCGPDGCNDWGLLGDALAEAAYDACLAAPPVPGAPCLAPLPFSASDHGYGNFLALVISCTVCAFLAGVVAWSYILRLL